MISTVPRIAIPEPTSTDTSLQPAQPAAVHARNRSGGRDRGSYFAVGESPAVQAGILASCSAILLPGSPADVDPARYGQEACRNAQPRMRPARPRTIFFWRTRSLRRNRFWAFAMDLQSLNVWRRGSLIQDLPHAPEGAAPDVMPIVNHEPGREVQNAHPVLVTPGSRLSHLAGINGQEELRLSVNSSHHQAVDRPGEQLMVAAISPVDGVIEALEGIDPRQFVVAVQWHPERSYESSEASRALFAAFVEAARAWDLFARRRRQPAVSSHRAGTVQEIQEAFAEAGINGLPASCYDQFSDYLRAAAAVEHALEPDRHPRAGTDHPPPFCGVCLCRPASPGGHRKPPGLRLGSRVAGDPLCDLPSRDPRDVGRGAGKEGFLPAGSGADNWHRD